MEDAETVDSPACWAVITVTHGGTVSVNRNLTEEVARRVAQLCGHDPWPSSILFAAVRQIKPMAGMSCSGGFRTLYDGDIKTCELIGPPGESLDVWPQPPDYEARVNRTVQELKAVDEEKWRTLFGINVYEQ